MHKRKPLVGNTDVFAISAGRIAGVAGTGIASLVAAAETTADDRTFLIRAASTRGFRFRGIAHVGAYQENEQSRDYEKLYEKLKIRIQNMNIFNIVRFSGFQSNFLLYFLFPQSLEKCNINGTIHWSI